jgi:Flp pilus assembly pilin Flp
MQRLIRPAYSNKQMQREENRSGAAMVEFAVMIPLFVMVMLGSYEIGNALELCHTLESAVREGGRLVAMDFSTVVPNGMTVNEKVIADIKNFLIASGLNGSKVTITLTSAEASNLGAAFDISDPANEYKMVKIKVSMKYEDRYGKASLYMKGQTISRYLIFRVGKVSLYS